MKRFLAFGLLLVASLTLDQATKLWAADRLAGDAAQNAIVLIDGYLRFEFAANPGAAWSFLADQPGLRGPVLISVAALAILLLGVWAFRVRAEQRLLLAALGCLLSGAIGNLIDRIRLGYVIDFIVLHVKDGFRWPTFNVADIAIVVGVGLLLLDSLRGFLRERRQARASWAHLPTPSSQATTKNGSKKAPDAR